MSRRKSSTLKTIQKIYSPLADLPEVEQAHYSEKSVILKSEIVREILDGRRKMFIRPTICLKDFITPEMQYLGMDFYYADFIRPETPYGHYLSCEPYSPDEVVFVRESFCCLPYGSDGRYNGRDNYYFRADGDLRPVRERWLPPSNMPKDASRIWLRMDTPRVIHLQSITIDDAIDAGIISRREKDDASTWKKIEESWDDKLSPKAFDNKNDWASNPWVWAVRFERIHYHKDEEAITWKYAKVERYREAFRKKVEEQLVRDLDRIDDILPDMPGTARKRFAEYTRTIVENKSSGRWRFVKLNGTMEDDMPKYGVIFVFTYRKIRCMYGWDADREYLGFFSIIEDDDVAPERYISMDDIK